MGDEEGIPVREGDRVCIINIYCLQLRGHTTVKAEYEKAI